MISLVIISGRSGSGKSTALHVLEDIGYFCIDNLPVSLLQPLIGRLEEDQNTSLVAVSIDARNIPVDLQNFPDIISNIDKSVVNHRIVYLDSGNATLVRRFSETRRKHPLSDQATGLNEALELETALLDPISSAADLTIDTTRLTIHELRDLIRSRITEDTHEFALLFQSFAYKNGVPLDADLVFDVRCLPNPHWKPGLRALTGLDLPVIEFLPDKSGSVDRILHVPLVDVYPPRFDDLPPLLYRQLPWDLHPHLSVPHIFYLFLPRLHDHLFV